MALDFNIEPFFDDYSEDDKFYRILFRPGYAIQARELTQMQTILHQQIKRHGDHVFKNGSMVIPGQIAYDNNTPYVKLVATTSSGTAASTSSVISSAVGKTYRGGSSSVEAIVLAATPLEVVNGVSEADTIYVKYTSGNGKFTPGEIITPTDGTPNLAFTVKALVNDAATLGIATTASIQRGIYYIKDNFVLVTPQTIVLSKYTSTPSIKAGLKVLEDIKYPEDDGYDILLDNALGSPNYAAPGAARYHIDLVLTGVAYDLVTDPYEFIPLLTLLNGNVQFLVDKSEYAQIEKTLARRTYDESGDYTVRPFPIQLKEYRNNYRTWANNNTFIKGDIISVDSTTYKCILNHTSATSGIFAIGANWIEDTTPVYNYGLYTGSTYATNIAVNIIPDTLKLSLAIEPGKAYVKGFEVEKIATQYLTIDKSRSTSEFESITIDTSPGNYIIVNNVNYIPDIGKVITFYDRNGTTGTAPVGGVVVATARAKQIQLHTTGKYKLFLFDLQVVSGKNFSRDAKFAYSATGTEVELKFTAFIESTLVQLAGNLVSATSSTTINAINSTFSVDFKVGDYINVSGTNRRVTAITSNNSLTIDTASVVDSASTNIYRVEATLNDPTRLLSLYSIPRYAIHSASKLKYTFYKKAINQNSGVTISEAGYAFGAATDATNYIVVSRLTGVHQSIITSGTPSANQCKVVVADTTATFTMNSAANTTYDIIYAIRKANDEAVSKLKVLTNITETGLTVTGGLVKLSRQDGFELIRVTDATGLNITSSFKFDSGQTNSYYDLASISTTDTITGLISVTYSYFNHLSGGDYFSVNSYTDTSSNITYEELPSMYTNTVDFRPRKTIVDGTEVWDGGVVPKYGEQTDISYDYYLGRTDKLSIDVTGNLIISTGIPSVNPAEPKSPDNAMDLYKFYVEPYTFNATGVQIEKVENKRYTMRDIGKLETRIKNLEYYTSLSLVEQNTINLKSYDSSGIERPQNGFLVDGFNGQGIGDSASDDWNASIDSVKQELRPSYTVDNISLFEEVLSTLDRSELNYEVNGDLVTLKIASTTPLVKQLRASRTESVNPFDVYAFAGTLDINPWSDSWFETKRRPDVIINDNGQYNAVVAKAEASGVLGTVWNAPTTLWFGESVTGTAVSSATIAGTTTRTRQGGQGGGWSETVGPSSLVTTTVSTIAVKSTGVTTGIQTSIVSSTTDTVVGDKVVSTEVIPYMRSRNILFRGEAFKPETRMYAFFDGILVDSYIKPAKRIEVAVFGSTSAIPSYSLNNNVGINVNSPARKVNGLVESAFTYGEVLYEYKTINNGTASKTGVTCIVVGQEVKSGSSLLYIDNVILTAPSGDQIATSLNANTVVGTVNTVYHLQGEFSTTPIRYVSGSSYNQSPTVLSTTYSGQLFGTFNIPNNAGISFRTGVRQLRFTDSATNTLGNELTYSEQSFESRGTLEWKEKTILSTKTAQVASANVSEDWTLNTSRTETTSTSTVINQNVREGGGGGGGYSDPLAQTFMVDVAGGVFITDIDLFFATKDENIPIKIEFRNVVNGYPGAIVVPYSTVVKYPSTISVDNSKGKVATKFKFKSPVYLQSGTEYCVCIFADSAKYKIWVAQSGEFDVDNSGLISTQPYMGVLFKSQNSSTWTADQSQDLKFQLNRAVFNTTSTATLGLVNSHIDTNKYFDVLQVNVNNLTFTNTSIATTYSGLPIELGKNVMFDSPKLIKSAANELVDGETVPSLKAVLTLKSSSANVSPVVDLSRCSATIISNVIEAVALDGETVPDTGTATAKYVTKQINLSNNATTLRMLYSANVPNLTGTDVNVYYKVGDSASTTFKDQPYILATAATPYAKTQNYDQFSEAEYLIENMTPFNSIKVKLVFKSGNTSQVPRVKNLRVLAYA